jgi:hypothetical protein
MTALAGPRSSSFPSGGDPTFKTGYIGLAANAKVYQGAIVVYDPATGYGRNGYAALGLIALGRAEQPPFGAVPALTPPGTGAGVYDNTGGANGGVVCSYRQGVFSFANSAAADLIAVTNIGADCYIVDDQTVALTDNQGTRSRAGKIVNVDSQGVWVQMGLSFAGAAPSSSQFAAQFFIPALAGIAANSVIARFTPGFAGRVKSISFAVATAVTTAAKSANLQAGIGAAGAAFGAITQTTGGVLALTSANATPAGAAVYGSAITAANTFTAAQEVSVVANAVTAFVEGAGTVTVVCG